MLSRNAHMCSPAPSVETAAAAESRQSCPTLCYPIDGSPPGSPVPGILQARMHESEKWNWSGSGVSDSSSPHGLQPTRLRRPSDLQARALEWVPSLSLSVETTQTQLRAEQSEDILLCPSSPAIVFFLAIPGPVPFYVNFRISLSSSTKEKASWDFVWGCIEFRD